MTTRRSINREETKYAKAALAPNKLLSGNRKLPASKKAVSKNRPENRNVKRPYK
jgi:hypothetical protein